MILDGSTGFQNMAMAVKFVLLVYKAVNFPDKQAWFGSISCFSRHALKTTIKIIDVVILVYKHFSEDFIAA